MTSVLAPGPRRRGSHRLPRALQWVAVVAAIAVIATLLILMSRGRQPAATLKVGGLSTGDIETVVGTGANASSGDGGPAVSAGVVHPAGLAYDRNQNLIIVDSSDDQIRMLGGSTGTFYGEITTVGSIYTIAGDGIRGSGGYGHAAIRAKLALSQTSQVVADAEGNLLFADSGNGRIDVIAGSTGDFYGEAMVAGNLYTLVGGGTVRPTPNPGINPESALLENPNGVGIDPNGNVVLSDSDNGSIDVLAQASGTFWGRSMTSGFLYRIGGTDRNGRVTSCSAGRSALATAAVLGAPAGLDVDSAGNIVVALSGARCVAVLAAEKGVAYGNMMVAGHLYPIAGGGSGALGDGGPALDATLVDPVAVTLDSTGDVLVTDAGNAGDGNRIRLIGESISGYWGVVVRPQMISTVAGTGVPGFSGDDGPAKQATLSQPAGIALDDGGDLVISDSGDNRVQEVIGAILPDAGTTPSAPLPTAQQGVIPVAVATTTTVKPTTTTAPETTTTVKPTATTTVKPTTTTTGKQVVSPTTASTVQPGDGYRLIAASGLVIPAGDAPDPRPGAVAGAFTKVVAAAAAPHLDRFWEVAANGLVMAFNGAVSYGSPTSLSAPIVAAGATVTGNGYWLISSDGTVHAFGDAGHFAPVTLSSSSPIVSMTVDPSGEGYWLVAADGTIYPEGNTHNYGTIEGVTITTIAATPNGKGYWLGSSSGKVYAFGDAGSFGGITSAIVAIIPAPGGTGYWLINKAGGVGNEGSAPALALQSHPVPPIATAIAG
jgi:hypothetical protein